MNADRRKDGASGAVSRHAQSPASPLDRLVAEHELQLELCDALELIADGLPNRIPSNLVREVTAALTHGLSAHFSFEEDVLFPLLRQRGGDEVSLAAALDQLESEHARDAGLCDELAEELKALSLRDEPRNVEMLGYMLRGFFEGQRRHIEWENTIVVPAARRLLTTADLDSLVGRWDREGGSLTTLRYFSTEITPLRLRLVICRLTVSIVRPR
jgi:hemerythrin-like domain-containing protein